MYFNLTDYQDSKATEAVALIREGFDDHRTRPNPRPLTITLAAPTASGKTVMAASIIERLLHGDDTAPADPHTVVLWFSSSPTLNAQSRAKIEIAADLVGSDKHVDIDNSFDEPKLAGGAIYYFNHQKFSSNLMKKSDGQRRNTLWDIITATLNDRDTNVLFLVDEAHEGMGESKDADTSKTSTYLQRLIVGDEGTGRPGMPVILGLSATPNRFEKKMASILPRRTAEVLEVTPQQVRDSGLLKEQIAIKMRVGKDKDTSDTQFLRQAVRSVRKYETHWHQFANNNSGYPEVRPLLLVQMPNTPSKTLSDETIKVIREEWPDLPSGSVRHAMTVDGGHGALEAGGLSIKRIEPQDVQDDPACRVLLAKTGVTTGWDCPRAEVLFSYRGTKDDTVIAQLIGRMVRTPLAHRIDGDEWLNTVACYLPSFHEDTVAQVVDRLADPSVGGLGGIEVTTETVDVDWNPLESVRAGEARDVLMSLPRQAVTDLVSKPMTRLMRSAIELSNAGIPGSHVRDSTTAMAKRIVDRYHADREALENAADDIETASLKTLTVRAFEKAETGVEGSETVRADRRTIEDAFKGTTAPLGGPDGKDAIKQALKTLSELDDADEEQIGVRRAKALIVAISRDAEWVAEYLEAADKRASKLFEDYAGDIADLPHEKAAALYRLRDSSRDPVDAPFASFPEHFKPVSSATIRTETANGGKRRAVREEISTWPKHITAAEDGLYPAKLNGWEVDIARTELAKDSVVAWYRNPSRGPQALSIPYRIAEGWRPLYPDFIFFVDQGGTLKPAILDPHLKSDDSLPKLRGLADYTEAHGDQFTRIWSLIKEGAQMRYLDLKEEHVRKAVREDDADVTAVFRDFGRNYQVRDLDV